MREPVSPFNYEGTKSSIEKQPSKYTTKNTRIPGDVHVIPACAGKLDTNRRHRPLPLLTFSLHLPPQSWTPLSLFFVFFLWAFPANGEFTLYSCLVQLRNEHATAGQRSAVSHLLCTIFKRLVEFSRARERERNSFKHCSSDRFFTLPRSYEQFIGIQWKIIGYCTASFFFCLRFFCFSTHCLRHHVGLPQRVSLHEDGRCLVSLCSPLKN